MMLVGASAKEYGTAGPIGIKFSVCDDESEAP